MVPILLGKGGGSICEKNKTFYALQRVEKFLFCYLMTIYCALLFRNLCLKLLPC